MLKYQHRDAVSTLGEGLAEYYASRADLIDGRGLSDRAREFFRCHDTAHIVFGCSTLLADEAIVKTWSLFGTTAGLGLLRDYRLPESQEVYQHLEWRQIAATTFRSLVVLPGVLARCRRMKQRWPWSDFDRYHPVSLLELRREYGIEVVTVY